MGANIIVELSRLFKKRFAQVRFTSIGRINIMRALFEVRGYSSAGRALAWHARGQRFDPAYLHQKILKNQSPYRLEA